MLLYLRKGRVALGAGEQVVEGPHIVPSAIRRRSDDQIFYFAAQAVNTSAMLDLIRQLNAAWAAATVRAGGGKLR